MVKVGVNNMKKTNIIALISGLISLFGCGHTWSSEEKLAMQHKCELIDSLNDLSIGLAGFDMNEIDTILIKERNASKIVDSFNISAWQDSDKGYHCNLGRTINMKNSFEILIPGQRVHVIYGMQWEMAAHYTNDGEGYGCEFGKLYLDSFQYSVEDNSYWIIRKE